MRFWKIEKLSGNLILIPSSPIYCPICGGKTILHDFRCSYSPTDRIYHCDVHMKCLNCSFHLTFGVPVSYDEYVALTKSKHHGKILKLELTELYKEESEEIERRLKSWGYW